jgi:tight adherence protein B
MEALMKFFGASPGTEYFFVLSCVFAGTIFFISGLYFSFIRPMVSQHSMSRRLWGENKQRIIQTQLLRAEKDSEKSLLLALVKHMAGWGKVENLQHALYQADIFCPPEVFLSTIGILTCAGYMIGSFFNSFWWRMILPLGLGGLPYLYLRIKQYRKTSRLEKQMPEGMELLSRSLRAGHTLQSSMELASSEIGRPLGVEFKIAFEEQRLGLGLNKALRRMADRVASQDLRFFVTAVLIQSETGGNLAEILDNIGHLIRDRLKLKGKIQGLTAEGRFSALILAMLPVAIFLLLYFINRKYIAMLLDDPLGHKMLMGGILSMILGVMWMKKMIQIKV